MLATSARRYAPECAAIVGIHPRTSSLRDGSRQSASSIDRRAVTRNARRTATVATKMAGKAITPPLNAITRIPAASTSQRQAFDEAQRPERQFRPGYILLAECNRHLASLPHAAQPRIEPIVKFLSSWWPKQKRHVLFFRLGREQKRIALGAAGVVARVALVSATSRVNTATTQTPR